MNSLASYKARWFQV